MVGGEVQEVTGWGSESGGKGLGTKNLDRERAPMKGMLLTSAKGFNTGKALYYTDFVPTVFILSEHLRVGPFHIDSLDL